MPISLGGVTYTDEQVFAAIAASNDNNNGNSANPDLATPASNFERILGLETRVAAVEQLVPVSRAATSVSTTYGSGETTYKVQTLNERGETIYITYTIPDPQP